jgi:hypothetical protein
LFDLCFCPNLFGGKFFDLLHDSAENIRDAKETQHLRKIKVVDKQESKPSNLHVGAKRKVVDGDYSADSCTIFNKFVVRTPDFGGLLTNFRRNPSSTIFNTQGSYTWKNLISRWKH